MWMKLLCLNPYYTGIHLHAFNLGDYQLQGKKVLILIILEYIYIQHLHYRGLYL